MEQGGPEEEYCYSQVIEFMNIHQELTVKECLDLYLETQLAQEEQKFEELRQQVWQTSDAVLSRVNRDTK
jgi:hypothetical protein